MGIKLSTFLIKRETPMLCEIFISMSDEKSVGVIEKILEESKHWKFYNNDITIKKLKKGLEFLIEIPGYKYRCSYCKKLRESIKLKLSKITKIQEDINCIEFCRHIGSKKEANYSKIKWLMKNYSE